MEIRTDSRSIALFAIFTSIIIALEVFPIVGLTDFYTPVPGFTIDWTGIPIMIIFLGLGVLFSVMSVGVMWVFIAYRNFAGAAFKGLSEILTLLGLIVAKLALRNRDIDWKWAAGVYLISAAAFRSIGMYFGNIMLFTSFGYMPFEVAIVASTAYIPWNILQATINVMGGVILYRMIPESLAMQAGLGKYRAASFDKYEEISADELESTDDE
ncbi:MAG: hypothetical protein ACXACG_07975 [Candidatus Thorarchaeota archaeon]|jgi:hypothetical protein